MVTRFGSNGQATDTTVADESGRYEFTLDSASLDAGAFNGVDVTAQKDGFEPSLLSLVIEGKSDARHDLPLHRIVRVAAGDSVRLSIGHDDPLCRRGSDSWPCRRIRVVASTSDRLTVWVDARLGSLFELVTESVEPGSEIGLTVTAGSETVVDVVLLDRAGRHSLVLDTVLGNWWEDYWLRGE